MGWDVSFSERARDGNLTVGIIGLGYVGLPTAIGFHDAGFNVWGVDISDRTVRMILAGENPTGDPDVNDIIPDPNSSRWNITTNTNEAVPHCDVVLVTVPTRLRRHLKPIFPTCLVLDVQCSNPLRRVRERSLFLSRRSIQVSLLRRGASC